MMNPNNNPQDESCCAAYYGPYPKCDPVPITKKTTGDDDGRNLADHRDVGTPDEWVTRDG